VSCTARIGAGSVVAGNPARLLAKVGALPAALERRYAAARTAAGEGDP
jgi:hypothetical protein